MGISGTKPGKVGRGNKTVRPHGAGEIIPFDEVFEYVYSPNVKEFLAEAESVTLHTLIKCERRAGPRRVWRGLGWN
jgi:hypothetical protein